MTQELAVLFGLFAGALVAVIIKIGIERIKEFTDLRAQLARDAAAAPYCINDIVDIGGCLRVRPLSRIYWDLKVGTEP